MKIENLKAWLVSLLRLTQKRKPADQSREDQLTETQKLISEAKQLLSSLLAKEHALSQSISAERNDGPLMSVEYKTTGAMAFKVINVLRPTTVWDVLADLEQNMPRPESTSTGFTWNYKKDGPPLPEISARNFWDDKGVAFKNREAEEILSLTDYLDERSVTTQDGVTHRVGVVMLVKDQDSQQTPGVRMWIGNQDEPWSSVTDTVLMAPIGPGSTLILKEEEPTPQV